MKASPLQKYTTYTYFLLRLRNFVEKEVFSSGFFHFPAYKELHGLIGKVATEFDFVVAGISQLQATQHDKDDFINAFLEYVTALKKSTLLLGNIVGKLKSKSEGNPYPRDEYDKDIKEYERAVSGYMNLGKSLNILGDIHNKMPKAFLDFLEETIDVIIKDWKKEKLSIDFFEQFKYSIFSEE